MRRGLWQTWLLATTVALGCHHPSGADDTELLWPDGVPAPSHVSRSDPPLLYYFEPPAHKKTDSVAIIAPGGSYGHHGGLKAEGIDTARWLTEEGITAVLVRHRVGWSGRYNHEDFLADGRRAVRTVRAQAGELGVDPEKIGMFGFSAGGHLASLIASRCADDGGDPTSSDPVERQSCRIAYAVLVYPVITLDDRYTHRRSRNNLLNGINSPSAELLTALSTETQVRSTTAPTFVVHSRVDHKVDWHNSELYYRALVDNGVPAQLEMYDDGGHGVGLATDSRRFPQMSTWPDRCLTWLRARRLLPPGPGPQTASTPASGG